MPRRTLGILALVGVLVSSVPPSAGAAAAKRVIATKKSEESPAASAGWLTWAEASVKRRQYNVVAQPQGGERFRVNPSGTEGFPGSIDGTRLVYNQLDGKKGDIVFFDLQARTQSTPSGVNTPAHESAPSVSGNWLLYRRSSGVYRGTQSILLRNLSSGEERLLGTGNNAKGYAQPGTVQGDFASWYKCRGYENCTVFRYQISTGATTPVPNPGPRAQYAPSVLSDGTVFFVESSNLYCGKKVATLWRFTASGSRERIGSLPRGEDPAKSSPVDNGDGTATVYLDAYDCSQTDETPSDIWKLTG